jgi:hypothetical protein
VEPCREELPLTLGLRQMQFKNDVRCAVRRSGRRRRPRRHGCAAAPACRTFPALRLSLVDRESRCAESGENVRRTQNGASDSDAGLHLDVAVKTQSRLSRTVSGTGRRVGAGSLSEGRAAVGPGPLVGPDGLALRREGPRQVMTAQSGTISVPRRTAIGGPVRLTIRTPVISPPTRWVPGSLRYFHCSRMAFS